MSTARMLVTLALPMALLAAGCATTGEEEFEEEEVQREQRTGEFAVLDEDADGVLGREEFNAWWGQGGVFTTWDEDSNGEISQDEYARGLFERWDANGDGIVSESEWQQAKDRWYGEDADPGPWSDWDADGDSELDMNEVQEGIEFSGLYDTVDGDDDFILDDEELSDFFFDTFDLDDNDEIDTTEWDEIG